MVPPEQRQQTLTELHAHLTECGCLPTVEELAVAVGVTASEMASIVTEIEHTDHALHCENGHIVAPGCECGKPAPHQHPDDIT